MDKGVDIFEQYATDESLEKAGVWIVWSGNTELRIARQNNPEYNTLRDRLVKPYRSSPGGIPEAKSIEILIEVMARTVLLDWKNLRFKGEDLPYTFENAKRVLAVKDFRAQVLMVAAEAETFRRKQVDDAGKNSEVSLGTTSNTVQDETSTQNG